MLVSKTLVRQFHRSRPSLVFILSKRVKKIINCFMTLHQTVWIIDTHESIQGRVPQSASEGLDQS